MRIPPARRRIFRVLMRVTGCVLAALMVVEGTSYARALLYPGRADWQVRTVDWIRDQGGSPVVDTVQNWIYGAQEPSRTGLPAQALPAPGRPAGPAPVGGPAAITVVPGLSSLRGEGIWTTVDTVPGRQSAVYSTYFRPDPAHTSVLVGVAWLRRDAVRIRLVAGTREPGGATWPEGNQIPATDRPVLLAAFNSGFKFKDTPGGFLADGRVARGLEAGVASLVVHKDGRVTIGTWDQDQHMAADVVAVRQNLHLIVEAGRPMPRLKENRGGAWGGNGTQYQYTWRSGIGTDVGGNLVYVAGKSMTLAMLADAMVRAGIVRGMPLDIHQGMVNFSSFRPSTQPERPIGQKLLPAMPGSAYRYFAADQRDFFVVTRAKLPAATG